MSNVTWERGASSNFIFYFYLLIYLAALSLTWASQVAPSGKEPACRCRKCKRVRFDPWVRKIPWSRKWHPTLVFLPEKSHGQWSLAVYSPWVAKSQTRLSN